MEKKISDSKIEQVYQVRPEHLNGAGRLFGGRLMEWIDEAAGLVDNLRFIRGAYQNDLLVLAGRLTYVGTTSMEVRVDTYVETLDGIRRPINRAYLTLVAVDKDGNPTKVPSVILETESEKAEWEAGKRRRELRIQRKKEGF